MLELVHNNLQFAFPDVHPGAKMNLSFVRTLRLPDDGKEYHLPPGLGNFPLRQVDEFKERVPAKWVAHGGVMMPMYQSEALWLKFGSHDISRQGQYPFALKIAAGKVSALTGEEWKDGLQPKDYAVVPNQPWLDGYVVEEGLVRQFVAAPLGSGFSAEEQITGKAEYGGIQVEVYPMKREVFERRFPKKPNILRAQGLRLNGDVWEGSMGVTGPTGPTGPSGPTGPVGPVYSAASAGEDFYSPQLDVMQLDLERSVNTDMGLAAGGKMRQQVFEDPYDADDWDLTQRSRCFIHLANSLVWRAITKQEPPTTPRTAADYTASGLPWFDYYTDDWKSLEGTDKLKGLKGVLEMGFQKGMHIIPENESVSFKSDQVRILGDQKRKESVRAGTW